MLHDGVIGRSDRSSLCRDGGIACQRRRLACLGTGARLLAQLVELLLGLVEIRRQILGSR